MKNIFLLCALTVFTLSFQHCTSQSPQISENELNSLLSSKEFSFEALKANPSSGDAYNLINNMPNGAANRLLNLTDGEYSLIIKNEAVEAVLPYYGRRFSNAHVNNQDASSLRFVTKKFDYTSTTNKKGNTIIRIKPSDVSYINNLIIEVFKNGKASLSVDSKDRQPISFDGYISKLPEKK